jgi:hypothetical protein
MKVSKDFKTGIFLVLFAILLFVYLIPNHIVDNPRLIVSNPAMSSRLFPYVLSIGLGIVGIAMMIAELVNKKAWTKSKHLINQTAIVRVLALFGIALLYYWLMGILGYILTSMLILPVLMLFYGYRQYKVIVIISIAFPLIMYYLFVTFMYVPLPKGILF